MAYLLQQLLATSADRYPDKPAVEARGRSLTYAELERRSNQLAHLLRERGVRHGDRVGLYFPKAVESLVVMHGVYWVLIHPVNGFWLRETKLEGAGAKFFSYDPLQRATAASSPDWTRLRDRWEYAHLARAVLTVAALVLLLIAVV